MAVKKDLDLEKRRTALSEFLKTTRSDMRKLGLKCIEISDRYGVNPSSVWSLIFYDEIYPNSDLETLLQRSQLDGE